LRGENRKTNAIAVNPTTNRLNSLGSGATTCRGWASKLSESEDARFRGSLITGVKDVVSMGELFWKSDPESESMVWESLKNDKPDAVFIVEIKGWLGDRKLRFGGTILIVLPIWLIRETVDVGACSMVS
jgi:hypothetical protein